MSKCKYTYMYFPLYKQVVLSEETVFNEGEGDTDILGNIIFQTLHKIHIDSGVFCIK
jgi:hypothetical protein